MRSDYVILRCEVAEELESELPEVLVGRPVLGCQVGPATSEGTISLQVFFEDTEAGAAARLADDLEHSGATDLHIGGVEAEDWLAEYRRGLQPLEIGRSWWLDPNPDDPSPPQNSRLRLVVEPRMAFGTGSHESTQLVLLDLEDRELRDRSVLDVGTGSGILALAALARGAGPVIGLDVDAQAVFVARETAAAQDFDARPVYFVGPVSCISGGAFDLVLCNMISEHFLPMLPDIRSLLVEGGELVLSGMLVAQRCSMISELEASGFRVRGERELNEWLSLCVVAGE